jgi:hypothetical protein
MNLLQTRRRTVDQAKMAKNRIRTDGFFDQLFRIDGRSWKKSSSLQGQKVLQQIPNASYQRVNAVARPSRALSARF